MELLSQKLSREERFSKDPETRGFDNSSGDRWIYPENYPIRDYQFSIVQSALYHNTLVCLPTGLGKTFIAAVVMYNFWRWYPTGKIVFLAPTKPLVAQQIKACRTIMGIESQETVELTGQMDRKKRQAAWSGTSRARVIFATPQVFHNDLEKNIVPTDLVKCVVIDEAHKALGKHSYCESIRLLNERSKYFRVLGLSATPGSKLDAVQQVIRNLCISRLELRDDASPDVTRYVNERKLEIVIVGLGNELEKFKERYIAIMDPHVRVLVENRVLPRGNTGNLSKGRMYYLCKEWQEKPNKPNNHGPLSKTLMILVTMYHAYELMIRHGLRAFYNFYQKHDDKFWLSNEHALARLLQEISHFLGPFPDVPSRSDETFPPISEDVRFGHNKFYKLQDLLLEHFETRENRREETRAIVFVEYRDIANELYALLLRSTPLLRPRRLVGRAGLKQKDQRKALDDFRSNRVNVLISTSVGEEGLDVGEVDLIVCFDVSRTDPIRLVQRMGRTGRQRAGRVVALVTDGKEHQALKSSMARRDSMNGKVLNSSGVTSALYENSPRMVPKEFNPECRKTSVVAPPPSFVETRSPKKIKRKGARDPRKRPADTANEPAASKNSDPAGSESLMKYLKRTREDVEASGDFENVRAPIIGEDRSGGGEARTGRPAAAAAAAESPRPDGATVEPSNVKLLTSDEAALEFLTLRAMKKSQEAPPNGLKARTNPYLPAYYETSEETNFSFRVPDLRILECLDGSRPRRVQDLDAPAGLDDHDSADYPENCYFRASRRLDDRDNVDPSERTLDEFSDSKFEALLDDSTSEGSDLRPSEPSPKEDDRQPRWNAEPVDRPESATEFDFEDSTGGGWWSKNEATNEAKTRRSDDRRLDDESDVRIPDPPGPDVKYGVFEELLNEDSETSAERDGALDDPGNGEFERSVGEYDSDATIDGLERASALADPPDEHSAIDSDTDRPDNEERRSAIDPRACRLATRSFGNSTLEAASGSRTNDESLIAKRDNNRSDADFAPVDAKSEKYASDESYRSTNVLETLRLSKNLETRESEDSTTRVGGRGDRTNRRFTNAGETSRESPPRRPTRREAFEGTSGKKNWTPERFVNKEYPRAAESKLVEAEAEYSRDGPRANSREISAGRNDAPVESDDDIFASDDIFADPNFEEEIIKIERSVGEISGKNGDTSASERPKKHSPPPPPTPPAAAPIAPTIDEDRPGVASLGLDSNPSAGKSRPLVGDSRDFARGERKPSANSDAGTRQKFFGFGLNFGAGKEQFFIRDRRESSLGDSDSNLENGGPSSENVKTRNSESTIPNPRAFARDFVLDDCDRDSSDFQVSRRVPPPRRSVLGKAIDSRESERTEERRCAHAGGLTEDFENVARISRGSAAGVLEPRLSLSKKLSRNIRESSWSVRRGESSSPLRPDSGAENRFVATRLEARIPENVERSESFDEADSLVPAKLTDEPFAMSKPVGSTRLPRAAAAAATTTPPSVIRNDRNRSEFEKLVASTPSEYRSRNLLARRDLADGEDEPRRGFASRDLDARKRKRSRADTAANKRARVRSSFLDYEAEVSTDVDGTSGTSGTSGADDDLEDFISYTQNISDEVDMHAHYLRTARSPRRLAGFFVRAPKSPRPDLRIYSQLVRDDEPDRYVNDSFCVDDDDDDAFENEATSDGSTILERLESRLRRKKRKRASSADSSSGRKRKLVRAGDGTTSSEDETEALRRQIREESFALNDKRE